MPDAGTAWDTANKKEAKASSFLSRTSRIRLNTGRIFFHMVLYIVVTVFAGFNQL